MISRILSQTILCFASLAILASCGRAGTDSTGREYMPDMGHSVAVEANVYSYYSLNTWDELSTKSLKELSMPGQGVKGTVSRAYNNTSDGSGSSYDVAPYNYGDTEEERTRATAEILNNPLPITKKGLESAKDLYNIYCGICHGEKGDGNGYLVRDDGGVYPAQPATFLSEEFLAASNGRYYHAIMHGKNVMGQYRDKLSYSERWNVIHYIRSLQAKETGKVYNEELNTYDQYSTPFKVYKANKAMVEDVNHSDGHENHAEDHMNNDTDH